jgi:hypothetical protein
MNYLETDDYWVPDHELAYWPLWAPLGAL